MTGVGTAWREVRELTILSGLAAWHGLREYTRSDNLTYAASIAYYSRLSLFPLFMLAFALPGHTTGNVASRNAMLEGFSWYMSDMTRFARVNGSIAAMIVFLIWVYAQAVILLYGVEFTAAYARLRRGRPEGMPAAPGAWGDR